MDQKDAILLQRVYDEKNLTRAADSLFMTQPALTYRIQRLEREFNIKMFIKHGKNIDFTDEGTYLVSVANHLLNDMQKAIDHLANMSAEVQGTLRIGATSLYGRHYLPKVLKRFKRMYPKVTIHVRIGPSPFIMDLLDNDQINVGFIRGDYKWNEKKQLINKDNMCLISNSKINLENLPDHQWIRYSIGSISKKYSPKTLLTDEIRFWWDERFNHPPNNTMLIDSYDTCKEMVKNGLGFSIIPRVYIFQNDSFFTSDLVKQNGDPISRNTWLMYKESSTMLRAVSCFIKCTLKISSLLN